MVNRNVYLDYNASAPLRPEAQDAMLEGLSMIGNASSVHNYGRRMRKVLEEARSNIKVSLGAKASTLIFTSGGTESNNLALSAFPDKKVFACSTSHASVLSAREDMTLLRVDSSGIVDIDFLGEMLRKAQNEGASVLLSVTLANSETGVVQPLEKIVACAKSYGALIHCDAAQAIGRIPFDFDLSHIDLLSFSSHKVGGPVGIGALIVRKGLDPQPMIKGGGQEYGKRAGSSNIAAAMGFAAALKVSAPEEWSSVARKRERLEADLNQLGGQIIAKNVARLPNTCAVRLPDFLAETQLMVLDLDGFAVSAGSACSSGKVGASHVLQAMGMSDDSAKETIRISLCLDTSESDIENFIKSWHGLASKKRDQTRSSQLKASKL